MKRICSIMLMSVLTTAMLFAQEVQSANSLMLQRDGNTYIYAGEKMNTKDYAEFLSTRNQPAYQQFMNGYKLQKTGWVLFGVGTGVAALGAAMLAIAPTMLDPMKPDMGGAMMTIAGATFLGAGATLDLVAIPMLGVGYSRMHKSVDTYNIAQPTTYNQPYWTIHTNQNGVGLALHF